MSTYASILAGSREFFLKKEILGLYNLFSPPINAFYIFKRIQSIAFTHFHLKIKLASLVSSFKNVFSPERTYYNIV